MPLFAKAWAKAATASNAMAGFRGSGIYPFNPARIKASLFRPSETTERPFQETLVDMPVDDASTAATPTHQQPAPDSPCHHDVQWNLIAQTPSHPLHDAVQPVTQPETEEVSFISLTPIPVRERPTTSRQRAKPPSWNLTSEEHLAYVEGKVEKGKGKDKGKGKENTQNKNKINQQDQEPCTACKSAYGDKQDPKCTEDWLACSICIRWFHQSCAEENGILDDDGSLTCKNCLFIEV